MFEEKKNYQRETAWISIQCRACGLHHKVLSSKELTRYPCPYCREWATAEEIAAINQEQQ
jgi:hypothetical protein